MASDSDYVQDALGPLDEINTAFDQGYIKDDWGARNHWRELCAVYDRAIDGAKRQRAAMSNSVTQIAEKLGLPFKEKPNG